MNIQTMRLLTTIWDLRMEWWGIAKWSLSSTALALKLRALFPGMGLAPLDTRAWKAWR